MSDYPPHPHSWIRSQTRPNTDRCIDCGATRPSQLLAPHQHVRLGFPLRDPDTLQLVADFTMFRDDLGRQG